MNIEQFNPTVAELNNLVVTSKKITKESELDLVKATRINLRDARISITKKGKELREEALAFQKAVISKEKELIEIITPEEERLQSIEDEVKAEKVKKERLASLPEKKEKLLAIDNSIWSTDEQILGMNEIEFSAFYNSCVTQSNEKIQIRLREEQAKLDEEKNKIAREQEIREAEEKARLQEEKRLASSIKYQEFLKKLDYRNDSEFVLKDDAVEVRVYKLIGTYTK